MNLLNVAMTPFVLLQATWSAEQSAQLIERLQPLRVIVHRREPQEAYYLFSTQEVLDPLAHAPSVSSVDQTLCLDERTPTPVLEGETDAEQAPEQCVIFEEGRLVGFFDATIPPQLRSTRNKSDANLGTTTPDLQPRSLVAESPETVQVE